MKTYIYSTVLLFSILLAGCVKQEFDAPEVDFTDPDISTNTSISELKATFSLSEDEMVQMDGDLVFDGIVVANDRSGNFYQQIVVQDETGGLVISIDSYDLYTKFPVGRKVYVTCQNLYFANDESVYIIGDLVSDLVGGQTVESFEAIPDAIFSEYIIDGRVQENISPNVVNINSLSNSMMSTLVQIDEVQFTNSDAGKSFADGVGGNKSDLNRDLEDCNDNTVVVRSSGYSTFANELTPLGKGSFIGVLSNYGTTRQLYVREVEDLQMDGLRCGQTGSGDGVEVDFEDQADDDDISLFGWTNMSTKGNRVWRANEFDGNTYAQATAYNDTNPDMETWLISPEIDFSVAKEMDFISAVAYYTHDAVTVLYADDFDGFDPSTAAWSEISCSLAGSSDNNYDWVNSGTLDLTSFSGEGHIAFKYVGSGSGNTGTFIIDDVRIQDK